jgi:hypothetical protein
LFALAAQHALTFVPAVVASAAPTEEDASAFAAQQAAFFAQQAAFSAAEQASLVSAGTVACALFAVCADVNVANPANANSNANFFIFWKDDFVKKYWKYWN